MINIKIKIKAKEIINLKLTDHFKYNEDSEFIDDMEIYEEAFDYATGKYGDFKVAFKFD